MAAGTASGPQGWAGRCAAAFLLCTLVVVWHSALGPRAVDVAQSPAKANRSAVGAVSNPEACFYHAGFHMLSGAFLEAHAGNHGVVMATFSSADAGPMMSSFATFVRRHVGDCSAVVGLMHLPGARAPAHAAPLAALQGNGMGVFVSGPTEGTLGFQAGRWPHAARLLAVAAGAGLHLLLSDSDVAWVRDPRPYIAAAFASHGDVDALSTVDYHNDESRPLRPLPRMSTAPGDLDLEPGSLCKFSINVGVLVLRADRRGARALLDAAVEAVRAKAPRSVDQGAINRAWKAQLPPGGLHREQGASCGLLDGGARLGVLPSAQFLTVLGYSQRRLHEVRAVEPICVHAVFLSSPDGQAPASKLMRMRENGLFADPWDYYEKPPPLLVYEPQVPPDAILKASPMNMSTGIPDTHLSLVAMQLAQLRAALAVAQALNRSLVLPRLYCVCEHGFGPTHVGVDCTARSAARMPHDCPADIVYRPTMFLRLFPAHREKGFLDRHEVPAAVVSSRTVSTICGPGEGAACCLPQRGVTAATLAQALGSCPAHVLDVGDVRGLLGPQVWSRGRDARFAERFGNVLGGWCCGQPEGKFRASGGVVPYAWLLDGGEDLAAAGPRGSELLPVDYLVRRF